MSTTDEVRAEAVEALDRLTQIALDNTAEDVHEEVYEDAKRVRAEWQASRKVEAAPSDTDREAWDKAFPKADRYMLGLNNLPSPWEAFISGRASQPVQVEITAEMVDRAATAVCEELEGSRPCTNFHVHESHKRVARSALTAALGGETND